MSQSQETQGWGWLSAFLSAIGNWLINSADAMDAGLRVLGIVSVLMSIGIGWFRLKELWKERNRTRRRR